jgi:hypothetical protein
MRKKFELQYSFDQKAIEDIEVNTKSRDSFPKLIFALKEIYLNPKFNSKIFNILEDKIIKNKKQTGRNGMNLWQIFVLAQTRLCKNISYDTLHDLANNHMTLRQLLGIDSKFGYDKITIEYQNIIDNVSLLDDETLIKINNIIVQMGHDIFNKKEAQALRLKTDSFVVESNVHFPTDYNLLWDSARKCADSILKLVTKYPETCGWRNLNYWYRELKNKMREISQSGKKSIEIRKELVAQYLEKAKLFSQKIKKEQDKLPLDDVMDLANKIELEYYHKMLDKHIDLLERRIIKGEKIPHEEKLFSIFETYTEWINKGKQNPNMELGKNVQITTDQFHLIIDHKVMENQVDKSTVISLSDRILQKYKVCSWSFDKGFYTKENKDLLSLFINDLIMPKKGKLNKSEREEEHRPIFQKLRNKHSAVESNINELEHRGLDRCPDKGFKNFKRYIALGVCAYNLHKIGNELLKQARSEEKTPTKKMAA